MLTTRLLAGRATALLAIAVVAACTPASGSVAGVVGRPSPEPSSAQAPLAAIESFAPASIEPGLPDMIPIEEPVPTASPSPSPTPTPRPVHHGPYAINLYHPGDFVSQSTKEHCVSAAMQIMLNIVLPGQDRTVAKQNSLATLARSLSQAPYGGTEPLGWARGLQRLGAGKYVVAIEPTLSAAIRHAARSIRATGRPVGLLVWWGAHSWVMHGFTADSDPKTNPSFRLTGLWISDTWYPRISSIWGASRKPNQLVPPSKMHEDYLRWRRPTGRYPGMDGKYVLVVPVR